MNLFPLLKRGTLAFFSVFALLLISLPALAATGPVLDARAQYGAALLKPGESIDLEVLITLRAPLVKRSSRPPVAVSLVLDRSGSMMEAKKIEYARQAAKILVNTLEPDDLFALTIYDSEVETLFPLGKVSGREKQRLLGIIDNIQPRGMTFLSGGLEEGIRQLQKIRNEGPARVILLSDGLANQGVTNVEQIAAIGAKARAQGIGVSSMGLGLDFDEDIMQLLAQRGGGQYYYIADSEYLPSVFKEELALVLNSFTKDLQVTYVSAEGVGDVKIYGYTTGMENGATNIEMGDFGSGEERQVMLRLKVTPPKKAGRQELGILKLNYADPDDGKAQELNIPLALEVVADKKEQARLETERADLVREVRDEALLRQADEEHLLAMQELKEGKVEAARERLQKQQEALAAPSADNVVIANKRERLRQDEENLERASRDRSLQNEMAKNSKASAYQSYQGSKQGNMLQAGDSGFMVEKLQNALRSRGFYQGDVDGRYGPQLEAAVRAFQKSASLAEDGIAGAATLNALGI